MLCFFFFERKNKTHSSQTVHHLAHSRTQTGIVVACVLGVVWWVLGGGYWVVGIGCWVVVLGVFFFEDRLGRKASHQSKKTN